MLKLILISLFLSVFIFSCAKRGTNWVSPTEMIKENSDYKISLATPCREIMGAKQCIGIKITIFNKSNNTIKLIWDDTTLVNESKPKPSHSDHTKFVNQHKPISAHLYPKEQALVRHCNLIQIVMRLQR